MCVQSAIPQTLSNSNVIRMSSSLVINASIVCVYRRTLAVPEQAWNVLEDIKKGRADAR